MKDTVVREARPADEAEAMQLEARTFAALRHIYIPRQSARAPAPVPGSGNQSPFSRLIVQDADHQIIGTVRWRVEEDRLPLRALAVASEHRRRGAARAIVEHCVAMARQKGLRAVSAYTVVETGNVPIFQHLGFALIRQQIDDFATTPTGLPVSEAYVELAVT